MGSVHASIQFERAFSGILSFNKKNEIDLLSWVHMEHRA
jgi:hypothetical protein